MLPSRIAKKPKRTARWRSQGHLNFIRSFHCAKDGCQGMPIECAHVRYGSGAGMGQKPDDWRVVPLCREHHSQQHTVGEQTFWKGDWLTSLLIRLHRMQLSKSVQPSAAMIRMQRCGPCCQTLVGQRQRTGITYQKFGNVFLWQHWGMK